jgi:hypothetical protein
MRERHCSHNVNQTECPLSETTQCQGFESECPPEDYCRSGLHTCDLRTHRCEISKHYPYFICVEKEKKCPYGYKPDAYNNCVDINECKHNPCKGKARCHNTEGSYKCICGYGFNYVKEYGCEDVNECAKHDHDQRKTCGHGGTCINTIGSFTCKCKQGYVYKDNGKGKLECVLDDCAGYNPSSPRSCFRDLRLAKGESLVTVAMKLP